MDVEYPVKVTVKAKEPEVALPSLVSVRLMGLVAPGASCWGVRENDPVTPGGSPVKDTL